MTIQDLRKSLAKCAHDRWLTGRRERGLDLDAPFEGDPAEELRQELADAWNYAGQLAAVLASEEHPLGLVVPGQIQDCLQRSWRLLEEVRAACPEQQEAK